MIKKIFYKKRETWVEINKTLLKLDKKFWGKIKRLINKKPNLVEFK